MDNILIQYKHFESEVFMYSNLTKDEYDLLMLYYRKDKGEVNMDGLIKKKDPEEKILSSLVEKEYINGYFENGIQQKKKEEYVYLDYQINCYAVSNKAIIEFNLDLPKKL